MQSTAEAQMTRAALKSAGAEVSVSVVHEISVAASLAVPVLVPVVVVPVVAVVVVPALIGLISLISIGCGPPS